MSLLDCAQAWTGDLASDGGAKVFRFTTSPFPKRAIDANTARFLDQPQSISSCHCLHQCLPIATVRTPTMENTDLFPLETRLEILELDPPLNGLGICPIEECPNEVLLVVAAALEQ